MNRRSFVACTGLSLALPLFAGSSRAAELEKGEGPRAKSGATHQSPHLSTQEILARVEALYADVTTFKANFMQVVPFVPFDRRKDFAGSVSFEKPGKMSWRFTRSGNRAVSDGSRIQIYERESKQVFERNLEESQFPAALSFLSPHGKLSRDFEFRHVDALRAMDASHYMLLGRPLRHSPVYEQLLLYIDAHTHHVRRVLLIDAQGNRNRFHFVRSQMNPRVPEDEFRFRPPRGTRIISS